MKIFRSITMLTIVLFVTVANAQTLEIGKVKADIADLLKNNARVLKTFDRDDENYDKDTRYNWGTEKNISVLDDRIEFRRKKETLIIYFHDFADYNIYATTDEQDNAGAILGDFLIMLKGKENGIKLADDLIFIQNQIKNEIMEKHYKPQLILFEPIAANYRELKIKPHVSEELRKYIVQANLFNNQKNYLKAIEFYIKAISTDQTSYPAAYSNLALLSAQVRKFYDAVYFMKKYLMLVPDASDARGAQDKIYEWEALLDK